MSKVIFDTSRVCISMWYNEFIKYSYETRIKLSKFIEIWHQKVLRAAKAAKVGGFLCGLEEIGMCCQLVLVF